MRRDRISIPAIAWVLVCSAPIVPLSDVSVLAIVETCAPELFVIELESKWMNQVQNHPGVGAKAYNIAGVGRNFRLV